MSEPPQLHPDRLCLHESSPAGYRRVVDDAHAERLAEIERENQALHRAVSLLHEIAKLVRESLELEPTCYAVLTGVTAGVGLGLNRAMLFLVDDRDRRFLKGAAGVGPKDAAEADRIWRSIAAAAPDLETLHEAGLRQRDNPGPLDRRVRETRIAVEGDSPVALALRSGKVVRDAGSDDLDGLLHLPTAVAAPLRGRDVVRGVIYADNRYTGRRLEPITELVFSLVADHAGRGIDSAHRYEQVARQARTDALTGLGHHGAMMEAVLAAVDQARSSATSLGLAMLDLDDFKGVNDALGHLAGDALLAGVAERLRANVRAGERVFRYGGEEFAVVLPGVDERALLAAGERLRSALAERPYPLGSGQLRAITCSVGLALLDLSGGEARLLIDAADQALLRAKARGKNRVELGA